MFVVLGKALEGADQKTSCVSRILVFHIFRGLSSEGCLIVGTAGNKLVLSRVFVFLVCSGLCFLVLILLSCRGRCSGIGGVEQHIVFLSCYRVSHCSGPHCQWLSRERWSRTICRVSRFLFVLLFRPQCRGLSRHRRCKTTCFARFLNFRIDRPSCRWLPHRRCRHTHTHISLFVLSLLSSFGLSVEGGPGIGVAERCKLLFLVFRTFRSQLGGATNIVSVLVFACFSHVGGLSVEGCPGIGGTQNCVCVCASRCPNLFLICRTLCFSFSRFLSFFGLSVEGSPVQNISWAFPRCLFFCSACFGLSAEGCPNTGVYTQIVFFGFTVF